MAGAVVALRLGDKCARRVRAGGRPRPTVVEQEKTPIVRRRNDIAIEKILTTAPSLRVVPERPLRGTDPTTTAHCPLHHPPYSSTESETVRPLRRPGAVRSFEGRFAKRPQRCCDWQRIISIAPSLRVVPERPTGADGAGSAYRPSPPPFTRPMNGKMLSDPAPIRSPVADYVLTNPPRSFPL